MKTYMTDHQIRLVGRVWEIRRYLKMAQQRLTTDVRLLQFLSEQAGYSQLKEKSRGIWSDADPHIKSAPANFPESEASHRGLGLTNSDDSNASRLHPLQLQYQPSKPGPRIIPFPSKQ
jgi:hypothetical protein